jgi:hypothetical protein
MATSSVSSVIFEAKRKMTTSLAFMGELLAVPAKTSATSSYCHPEAQRGICFYDGNAQSFAKKIATEASSVRARLQPCLKKIARKPSPRCTFPGRILRNI